MLDVLMVAGGLVLLVIGGDLLVRGAVGLSLRLGIPTLLISLTVVAFGTSAPELLIGIKSALSGVPGLALGNVVGSNIANVLLVLGIPALITPLVTGCESSTRSFTVMMIASLLFIALCFLGPLSVGHGLVLLTGLTVVLFDNYRSGMRARAKGGVEDDDIDTTTASEPPLKLGLFLLAGVISLPLGAQFLVSGAESIARAAGVSDAVIGLTLVAVGTSLPELATTVMAAIRRQAGVALGNVIGSNIFNLLGIMGVTALVAPIPVDPLFLQVDLWIMLGASAALLPFVFFGRKIGRVAGLGFLALYVLFIVTLF